MNNNSKKLQDIKYEKLTTKPVERLVVEMAIPAMIGMVISAMYNITDTYFVGLVGNTLYTAAIGIVFPFMSVIQAVGFLYGHGSGNYISEKLGKKDRDSAERMAVQGFYSSFITGLLIMFLGLMFLRPLSYMLGAKTDMIDPVCRYLRIILFSTPAAVSSFTLNNQLRLQGSSKAGMMGLMVGVVANVVLNSIFILGCGMNLEGAGWATLIGQFLGMIALLRITWRNGNVPVNLKEIYFSKKLLFRIWLGGMPNFVRQGITSLAGILLNNLVSVYGENAVASFSIAYKVFAIGYAIVIGLGHGYQPICGFNYSAQKYDRVKKAFIFSVKISTIFLIISAILIYCFSFNLMKIFSSDIEVIMMGKKILAYQSVVMPLLGYYTLISMFLQNTGRFYKATLISAGRQGIFYIPLLIVMNIFFGISGLILTQPMADIISFIFSLIIGIPDIKELNREVVMVNDSK